VIRTAICTPNATSIGIGGAVVALSDAEDEFRELVLKAVAIINAMVYAEFGEFGYAHFDIEGVPPELLNSLLTLPARLTGRISNALDARKAAQAP
jgi:para-aminobenzoate synthetase